MATLLKPLPETLKNLPRPVEYFEECPKGCRLDIFGGGAAFPLRTNLARAIERGECTTSRCHLCGAQKQLFRASEA